MESNRKISQDEERLIEFLIQKSTINFSSNWKVSLLVKPLKDGGMGSLLLLPQEIKEDKKRLLGKQVSECQFTDKDGIEVIASLNIDNEGKLFELDIWKTDLSSLIGILKTLK